ncbi:hypothetical protein GCM10027442_28630 [Emticicia fontis]
MSALAFSNAADKSHYEEREKRYLEIVGQYKKEEVNEFPNLLGMLVNHFEEKPRDILGEIFHELELHNERKGQFFTPYPICRMIAKMLIGESYEEIIVKHGFMNIAEPACGTGAMIIAAAEELKERNINYQQLTHITATDIDPICVHASYIQFTLMHIPAVVIHGDSLSGEEFSHWYTLAHTMGGWDHKLKFKNSLIKMQECISSISTIKNETVSLQESDIDAKRNEIINQKQNLFPGTQLTMF